jgi:hypothetical protein
MSEDEDVWKKHEVLFFIIIVYFILVTLVQTYYAIQL